MSAPLSKDELQRIAIDVICTQGGLLEERRPGDVVFVIFAPRVRTVMLVSPEEAATRLSALGEPYEATLAELRRNPAEVNGGAPGYCWIAANLNGLAHYSTAVFRSRPVIVVDAPAVPRALN